MSSYRGLTTKFMNPACDLAIFVVYLSQR